MDDAIVKSQESFDTNLSFLVVYMQCKIRRSQEQSQAKIVQCLGEECMQLTVSSPEEV